MAQVPAFPFELITPRGTLIHEDVTNVVLPLWDGEAGILAHHYDYTAALGAGLVQVMSESKPVRCFVVNRGLLEVSNGSAVILAVSGEEVGDVDRAEEQSSLAALEAKILKGDLPQHEVDALERKAKKIRARLAGADIVGRVTTAA